MSVNMMKRENDWCFLCMKRRPKLVAINYEFSDERNKTETQFIRICLDCLKRADRIIGDNKIPVNTTITDEE